MSSVKETWLVAESTGGGKGDTVGIIPFVGKVLAAFEFLSVGKLGEVDRLGDTITSRRKRRQTQQGTAAKNIHQGKSV